MIVLGYAGARLLDAAVARGWTNDSFQGIGILSLALFTYVATELVGGNGFIGAFVGGMVFGNTLRHPCMFLFEFMETEGQLLMLITFLVFGAALLPEGLAHLSAANVAYAVLSLTARSHDPDCRVACGLRGTIANTGLSRLVWPERPRVHSVCLTHS